MHEIEPAFLVEAEKLLQEGKSREAAVLCTRGLAKYPQYFTAYVVLIRALEAMGDYEQMQEVYDSAPNVIKFNINNSKINKTSTEVAKKQTEIIIDDSNELSEVTETQNLEIEERSENYLEESDADDPPEVNSALEEEINQAIRNDELNPEIVSDLTKSDRKGQDEIDIKETLTLAKIYEQQDAFEEALIIYKQLQVITSDKSKYTDKILELQTLVDEEKK